MSENSPQYDTRTMGRYVEKGVFKEADIKAYLKALPDESKNAQWVEVELFETEITETITDAESENPEEEPSEGTH